MNSTPDFLSHMRPKVQIIKCFFVFADDPDILPDQ